MMQQRLLELLPTVIHSPAEAMPPIRDTAMPAGIIAMSDLWPNNHALKTRTA